MSPSEHEDLAALAGRLQQAGAATPALVAETIDVACRRISSRGQAAKTARIKHLIDAAAWTDVALALIDLELPTWQIRRIVYDAGEWYCTLSQQRELPDWLDQARREGRHADLSVAIICALVEAQAVNASLPRPSVPLAGRTADALYDPVCCDSFG